jgi:hypothetical protein
MLLAVTAVGAPLIPTAPSPTFATVGFDTLVMLEPSDP